MLKKIIIGLLAGTVTGLFGSGGGMILVPAFTFILKLGEKEARATSVFCILPMVCASSIFYFNSSYIDFKMSILCAIRRSNWRIYWSKTFTKTVRQNTKNIFHSVPYICRN
ncbi:MAG: sulfite exporter TauE/SafE family protein [Clostridia bacterium]|nr:sulfite exporter TauE/SafE family protein [Clostridia bacterium]MCI9274676.1 sulfite exporter TauE/SafE family protein [Clostridia bacterium]